jgi:hypothetical protein
MSQNCKLNLIKTDDPKASNRCFSSMPCNRCIDSKKAGQEGLLNMPEEGKQDE